MPFICWMNRKTAFPPRGRSLWRIFGRFGPVLRLPVCAGHPFAVLLAIPGARIYDLDSDPVRTRRWTELESVRDTFEFFQQHKEEF